MNIESFDKLIADFTAPFTLCLDAGNFFLANRIALTAVETLFACEPKQARAVAWTEFFAPLSARYRTQYQCYDFEVVDYNLFEAPQSWSLLRGPRPRPRDLERGSYITVFGAAQLFGRYQRVAPHGALAKASGLGCMNFSTGGAGPELFAGEGFIRFANGGRGVILQVLSGRSIGCDEYPGGRMTSGEASGGEKIDRLKLLGKIWSDSPREAKRLAEKWRRRYVEVISGILSQITVPVILTWISNRSPEDWHIDKVDDAPDFGSFPQLVDRCVLDQIAPRCAGLVEIDQDKGLPHGFVSRFTYMKCPVLRPIGTPQWMNDYYPSAEASANVVTKLTAALKGIV